MRTENKSQGLKVMGIAGTHVVLMGWDMDEQLLRDNNVLGFAIRRHRHSDDETIWIPGMKTFKSVLPNPAIGVHVSTYKHPLQTFQWADYSVAPGQTYTYRVVARGGAPDALKDVASVDIEVHTESEEHETHAVYFNRGAVASQEYARRFQNRAPSQVGNAAYDWLSRGLIEGLLTFIGQAKAGDALHGAFFEFKNRRVYDALVAAIDRGVEVRVLYDGDSQRESNEAALGDHRIVDHCQAREHSAGFAHNKFFVYVAAGAPSQVWTGSTNLSENGLYGHSNNAHVIRDPKIAAKYLEYWTLLADDKTKKPTSEANGVATPAPPKEWTEDVVPVFSPRTDLDALEWYAKLAGEAHGAVFATFAFGMNDRFVKVYGKSDDVLRVALLEKKGNGKDYKKQAAQIQEIRSLPNTLVAVGNRIQLNAFDRWLEEIDRISNEQHVLYVHTKYMLIDPLGKEPKLIVGSANFSKASTDTNDENMVVIKNNAALADIYLGEFMRLYSHYAFRESLTFKDGKQQPRNYLVESSAWIDGDNTPNSSYFAGNTDRVLRRLYFSGQRSDPG